MVKEKKWIIRARETHNFHAEKKRLYEYWRLQDTARELERSLGSISEDLLVAKWLRTHYNQLSEIKYLKDAVEWIRANEHHLLEMDVD